jgi:hypothetical protein
LQAENSAKRQCSLLLSSAFCPDLSIFLDFFLEFYGILLHKFNISCEAYEQISERRGEIQCQKK